MAIDSRYKMSQERLDTLKEELHYLETTREKEVAEQIKEARSFGCKYDRSNSISVSSRSSVLNRSGGHPAASFPAHNFMKSFYFILVKL